MPPYVLDGFDIQKELDYYNNLTDKQKEEYLSGCDLKELLEGLVKDDQRQHRREGV